MALGNNTSMGQSRGKNRGTIVRKIREVDAARSFYSLSGSTVESGDAAACALHLIHITMMVVQLEDILLTTMFIQKKG